MVSEAELRRWFCHEVLPLEAALMRFIRRNWRSESEAGDIRQDIYERVLNAAARQLPRQAAPYLFTTARNVLINRARRAKVIAIDLVADIDAHSQDFDVLTPLRHLEGREALRQVQAAIAILPPRCREVILLRKVEGLSTREVAERLGVGIDAVEQQTTAGMRAVTDFMLGGSGRIQRRRRRSGPAAERQP